MVVLDTSLIIDLLRQKNRQSSTWLFQLTHTYSQLFTSIIVHTETYSGKSVWESATANNDADLVFQGLTLLPISPEISLHAGKLKAQLNVNITDALIAATAIHHKYSLATFNTKHFARIPHLSLLKPPG